MSKSETPANSIVKSKAPHDELPVVTSISLTEVKGGWVVLLIKTQGREVIDTEVLNEGAKPQPFAHAKDKYIVESVTRFINPHLKDKAGKV